MSLKFDFSDQHFVITGAGRGIGLEIARSFLEAGASVAVWDFSNSNLAHARSELAAYSSRTHFTEVDVSRVESVTAAVQALPFEIDGLVNNAGITRDKSFAKMTAQDFSAVIDTNLTGVFQVTQSLLPKFKTASNAKRIINIASVVALYGNFGQTNYVASKAGVIGMTKTWARELARKGFTSNAIAPGFIQTPMTDAMPTDSLKQMTERIPAGRLGQARDIANACLFLASKEASYINGVVLSVDGALVV